MAKYRYTIEFDTDEAELNGDWEEAMRKELRETVIDILSEIDEDAVINGVTVKLQDDYCLREEAEAKLKGVD